MNTECGAQAPTGIERMQAMSVHMVNDPWIALKHSGKNCTQLDYLISVEYRMWSPGSNWY